MDIKNNKSDVVNLENAHYIMLSLYREYSICMLNNAAKKDEFAAKMRQIKNDMKYLNNDELIEKTNKFYKKILQSLMSK